MFQIKDFTSILASLVNITKGITGRLTDFRPGSVVRTLLEAPAAEVEELYLQTFNGIIEAIPVAIYGAFGFSRLPAQTAYGRLTFSRSTTDTVDHVVAAGTAIQTSTGLTFVTTSDVTLLAGRLSVTAVARCATAGSVGNVAANTANIMIGAIDGIESATNLTAMTGGEDEETDAQRLRRFQEYIATLARGTNAAVVYGAKTARIVQNGVIVEQVVQAKCIEHDDEPSVSIGTIIVVVYNGLNGASGASNDLITAVEYAINGNNETPGYKSAGITASVIPAYMHVVNIVATATIAAGYDATAIQNDIIAAHETYFAALRIGQTAILAELISGAMAIDGVINYQIASPSEDVAVTFRHVATIGAVTLTMVSED